MKILLLLFTMAVLCYQNAAGAPSPRLNKWCCKSETEFRKCVDFHNERIINGSGVFDFDCVLGKDTHDCIKKMENGHADVIALDAGDIFKYRNDITVVAAEDYGLGDASYYAVAVVMAGTRPELSLMNVENATTCHTAIGKTAGWNMPMGWFKKNEIIPNFKASCAPGARMQKYSSLIPENTNDEKLCELCIGDDHGNKACSRNDDERYYGYHGAFRCLTDGAGEIAFVKHSIPLGESDPNSYELLCPNGKRAPPSGWQDCNFGRVPSHAIVMSKGVTKTTADQVFHLLQLAQENIDDFTTYGGKNLLWGSNTVKFLPKFDTAFDFLGKDFFCNMNAVLGANEITFCN